MKGYKQEKQTREITIYSGNWGLKNIKYGNSKFILWILKTMANAL